MSTRTTVIARQMSPDSPSRLQDNDECREMRVRRFGRGSNAQAVSRRASKSDSAYHHFSEPGVAMLHSLCRRPRNDHVSDRDCEIDAQRQDGNNTRCIMHSYSHCRRRGGCYTRFWPRGTLGVTALVALCCCCTYFTTLPSLHIRPCSSPASSSSPHSSPQSSPISLATRARSHSSRLFFRGVEAGCGGTDRIRATGAADMDRDRDRERGGGVTVW